MPKPNKENGCDGENEKTTMLQGHGINKYYGAKQQRRQVLHDVDIDVRSGGVPCGDRRIRIRQTTLHEYCWGSNTLKRARLRISASLCKAKSPANCGVAADWCSKAHSARWIRVGGSADPLPNHCGCITLIGRRNGLRNACRSLPHGESRPCRI